LEAVYGFNGVSWRCLVVLLLVCLSLVVPVAVGSGGGPGYLVAPVASGFKRLVVYYGWLNASGLEFYGFDVLVTAAPTGASHGAYLGVVKRLAGRGVEVFAYLHDGDRPVGVGSSFRRMVVEGGLGWREWLRYMEGLVDRLVEAYSGGGRRFVAGVFLDECDPAYLGAGWRRWLPVFNEALRELIRYIHSLGLKVMVNGVRAYAPYADYYLWEGFYSDCSGGVCRPDRGFMRHGGGDPYVWVNGYAKYEWLRERGLLNRTLAVTVVEPGGGVAGWCRAGYVLARVLGLAGWGCAYRGYNAVGGAPLDVGVVDPGLLVERRGVLGGVFTTGFWGVDVERVAVSSPYSGVRHHPVVDGLLDTVYRLAYSGGGFRVYAVYSVADGVLYVYVDSQRPPRIVFDVDSSVSTGAGWGVYKGGDVLVEDYGSWCMEYGYSKARGWYSRPLRALPCGKLRGYEVAVPGARGLFRVVVGGKATPWMRVDSFREVLAPCFLDGLGVWRSYGEVGEPVVLRLSMHGEALELLVAHPAGRYSLVIHTPFREPRPLHVHWRSLGGGAVVVEAGWRGPGVDLVVVESGGGGWWSSWWLFLVVGVVVAFIAVAAAWRHYHSSSS